MSVINEGSSGGQLEQILYLFIEVAWNGTSTATVRIDRKTPKIIKITTSTINEFIDYIYDYLKNEKKITESNFPTYGYPTKKNFGSAFRKLRDELKPYASNFFQEEKTSKGYYVFTFSKIEQLESTAYADDVVDKITKTSGKKRRSPKKNSKSTPDAPSIPQGSDTSVFIGRDSDLRYLEEKLRKPNLKLAIVGEHNIGKTELVKQLIPRIERYFKKGIYWVDANQDLEEQVEYYKKEYYRKNSLLIIDGITDVYTYAKVVSLLPEDEQENVIITSQVDVAKNRFETFSLLPLSRDEAIELFGGLIGKNRVYKEEAHIRKIIDKIGLLPGSIKNIAEGLLEERQITADYVIDMFENPRLQIETEEELFPHHRVKILPVLENCLRKEFTWGEVERAVEILNELPGVEFKITPEKLELLRELLEEAGMVRKLSNGRHQFLTDLRPQTIINGMLGNYNFSLLDAYAQINVPDATVDYDDIEF